MRAGAGEGRILEVSLDRRSGSRLNVRESFQKYDPHRTAAMCARAPHQALVRIMFGCDKFCSYCIVPSVRGPEQSRPVDEIVEEVRRLAGDGCLEVTLIGQTVNSYSDSTSGRTMRLSDLLARLHEIEGIRRLKFVTNYPRHMTDDLLTAVRDLPKVSPYLHIPAQSGSNEVLHRMKRGYSVEEYCEMLAQDPARRFPARRSPAISSWVFAAKQKKIFKRRSIWCVAGAIQKQFHIQVQRPAGHQGRGTF